MFSITILLHDDKIVLQYKEEKSATQTYEHLFCSLEGQPAVFRVSDDYGRSAFGHLNEIVSVLLTNHHRAVDGDVEQSLISATAQAKFQRRVAGNPLINGGAVAMPQGIRQ